MGLEDRIYLDHAATTPVVPAARAAMVEALVHWANPSSPHAEGRAARAALEDARARIKAALGWDGELIFTSGASEALGIAIDRCILPLTTVSAVEHDAVLRLANGVRQWPVQENKGVIGSPWIGPDGLVAVQQVNNETGVIQPIDRAARVVRENGGLLLADCAQSVGKIPLPDADFIALSAHKFGGPVGIGALLVRDFAALKPTGGQEQGYRSGTENLPGVCGMAAALELGSAWLANATDLREFLEKSLVAAGGKVVAAEAERIPTIGAYRMPGKSANAQLISFDSMGFALSAGSACSSGSLKTSHVLKAMWYRGANEVIRVSIGRETTMDHIQAFVAAWIKVSKL